MLLDVCDGVGLHQPAQGVPDKADARELKRPLLLMTLTLVDRAVLMRWRTSRFVLGILPSER